MHAQASTPLTMSSGWMTEQLSQQLQYIVNNVICIKYTLYCIYIADCMHLYFMQSRCNRACCKVVTKASKYRTKWNSYIRNYRDMCTYVRLKHD